VLRADRQEETLLQIYVLPARVHQDGSVVPDSTGLIAFSDKAKMPDTCTNPACRTPLKVNGLYIPGSLLSTEGQPIADLQKQMAAIFSESAPPPVFLCAACQTEIGPYIKLQDVPMVLRKKKEEVHGILVNNRNARRRNSTPPLPDLSEDEKKALKDSIALMIKADENTFYGRILQVVSMAKDTAAGIKNFAFVTLSEASQDAVSTLEKAKAK
jgi:hypothetical protein